MSKKIISVFIVILIAITIIATYNTIIQRNQKKQIEKFMNYINSDEIGSELKTPKFMHVVLATYKGKVEDLAILKSIMYFNNNIIPEIQQKCDNKIESKIYYKNHSLQISKQIGINNFDEFYEIVDKCNTLTENDEIEYIKFDIDSIKKDNKGLNVILFLKYNQSEEVSFNILILNNVYSNQTSVIIK